MFLLFYQKNRDSPGTDPGQTRDRPGTDPQIPQITSNFQKTTTAKTRNRLERVQGLSFLVEFFLDWVYYDGMSFSVGIIGLPNVGKSTLFKALTKIQVGIGDYPFTTIDPNVGRVRVPDERLEKIAQLIKPEKTTYTVIEFVDIAGLIQGSHKGEGLGNQFLAHIRNCDAILQIVRCFESEKAENVLKEINPEKEIETIKTELLMKDLETTENALVKLEKKLKSEGKSERKEILKKMEALKKIKEGANQGKSILEIDLTKEEKSAVKEYCFLTQKPIFYLLNTDGKRECALTKGNYLAINLKEEEEISEWKEEELKELNLKSQLDQLITACYNILDLITFYTVTGGKEVRAWTIKKGASAPEAGGVVHSDFEERFIKAEVIGWKELIETGSWSKAKERGLIKIVGKDYLVKDGDVIEFKI